MKKSKLSKLCLLSLTAFGLSFSNVYAEQVINVGVSVSSTGPAASLGIPEKNTVEIVDQKIDDLTIKYIVLDDAADTATAVRNMRKLISENNIDVMVGSSVTAASLAMVDVAGESKIPVISLNGNAVVVTPPTEAKKWAFKTAQNDSLMAQALLESMQEAEVKKLGFIGFADAYGTGWLKEIEKILKDSDIEIVANESFARTDTSVTGQVMKLIAAKPDAILVATAGTPGALPQRELRSRGYQGLTYHTHGSANEDFLRVCGKACEDIRLPVGPIVVAEQLPDDHPLKEEGLKYTKLYADKFNGDSVNSFGGHMWDASLIINDAVPRALKSESKPGTEEFREALRDAIENTQEVVGVNGVFNFNKDDHAGMDERARVMIRVKEGKWVYDSDLQK